LKPAEARCERPQHHLFHLYFTRLGGSGSEIGRSIAVDAAGNAYVAGDTSSGDNQAANRVRVNFK
jgi:hypothetical protein